MSLSQSEKCHCNSTSSFMRLSRTGLEIFKFIFIFIMKCEPFVKTEFVPVNYAANSTELTSSSMEGIDKIFYHKMPSLNKTKQFLKALRRDSTPTKLTTSTPFFIRRSFSTEQTSEGFNFHNSDFTPKQPSTEITENITNDTFKPHHGKIKKFFFHKTVEPKVGVDDSTTAWLTDAHNNQTSNIPTSNMQTSNEHYFHSNRYTIFNSTTAMGTNRMSVHENDIKNHSATCTDGNSKCHTTVANHDDSTDGRKQSSISLVKLINFKTNVRNKPGPTVNAPHPPQHVDKILGSSLKTKNYTNEEKQYFTSTAGTFTSGDESVLQTGKTTDFIINDTLKNGETNTILFETSFSPFTKIRLSNLFNFKDASKPTSPTKRYSPMLFKQNLPDKDSQTVSCTNPLYFANDSNTDMTPTSNSTTGFTNNCADSDFQTPGPFYQGIFIKPPVDSTHSKSTNMSTAVDHLKNVRVVQLNTSSNAFHGKIINSSEILSNNTESCRDLMQTITTPYGEVSNFHFKNLVNFKSRTTKLNALLVKSRPYTSHISIYGPTTLKDFSLVNDTFGSKITQPSFTNVSTIELNLEKQKLQEKYSKSINEYKTDTLPTSITKQTNSTCYFTESDLNFTSKSSSIHDTSTNTTLPTRTKLKLINFKRPKQTLSHLECVTTELETSAISHNETWPEINVNGTAPSHFNNSKNLLNNKKPSITLPEYTADSKPSRSELTEPISQYATVSTERNSPAHLEGSRKNHCLIHISSIPTPESESLYGVNISYGFDPGGKVVDNTSDYESFSKSSQPKITHDASKVRKSSGINRSKEFIQKALSNATKVQSNLKIGNRIEQLVFQSSTKGTLFTIKPKLTKALSYKYVESEEGNLFRWHRKDSDNFVSVFESYSSTPSTVVYKSSLNNTTYDSKSSLSNITYDEINVTSLPHEAKHNIKNMFNLKRPKKILNVTSNPLTSSSIKVIVTSNHTITEYAPQSFAYSTSEKVTRPKTSKCRYKTRGENSKSRRIYNPYKKVLNKETTAIKTEEINPNSRVNFTKYGTVNNNSILYNDFADYVGSHENHGLKIIKTNENYTNSTSNNSNTTNGILEFVFRPISFLVHEFKSNATKDNVSNHLPGIKNISVPNPLTLNSSLIILASMNNSANSSIEEIRDSKVGWLDMLGGWFHCVVESYIEPKPQDIHFYLYTRNNSRDAEELLLPEQAALDDITTEMPETVLEQESSSEPGKKKKKEVDEDYNFEPLNPAKSEIESKWFNVLAETKILVHGYVQDVHTNIMVNMKDAYLAKGAYNVIVVDWSVIGDNSCYPLATRALRGVGTLLARLLDRLVEGGVSLRSVHVVGFSLGAHVAGHAGADLRTGLVSRITGLDPALPYVPMEPEVSLDAGDAVFVDLIHSAAGYLGQPGPMGHVDFYPNGGSQQPGCDLSSLGTCSHRRSALYFIESITSEIGFSGSSCESWHAFQTGQCANNTRRLMGEPCPTNSSGKFYLSTGAKEPFAQLVEEHAKVKKSLLFDLFYDDNG